jgi:hypothetical protein
VKTARDIYDKNEGSSKTKKGKNQENINDTNYLINLLIDMTGLFVQS